MRIISKGLERERVRLKGREKTDDLADRQCFRNQHDGAAILRDIALLLVDPFSILVKTLISVSF